MSKKRSLADELAELFNPAPLKELDPEADPFGAGPALVESDEELAAGLQGSRRGREKAMRLRGDIELAGAQYTGRRTSRRAAFGSGSGGEGGSGSDSDETLGSEPDDELQGRLELGEEPRANGAAYGGKGSSGSEGAAGAAGGLGLGDVDGVEQSEDGSSPPEQSDSEGISDEEGGAQMQSPDTAASDGEGPAGEMAALEREYAAMRAAEAEAAAGLRERSARERQKALAVQAQAQLWQRGLEMRILLQRALSGANQLPQAATRNAAASHSAELQAAYGGVLSEAAGLLGDLSQLVEALHGQNAAVSEAAAEARVGEKRRRGVEGEGAPPSQQLWPLLDVLYGGFVPFRDASIDRWHRKTTLTTGGAVRSSLRALNQSVSTQVAAMMRDPAKLLHRTRVPRPHSQPLCAPADGQPEEDGEGAGGEEDARDPETYDDTEFYQTLLREFLEGSAGAAGAGGNWFSGPKQRKVVDRRASKGRKIRYHVHEKLVNFMTPVEAEAPQFAAQLFGNLFGGAQPRAA